MIVYIHGFDSAPQSFKARLLEQWFQSRGRGHEYVCPALPPSPRAAIAVLEALLAAQPPGTRPALIGSSLGGYYATWLAERHDLKAVLVNPAVRPYDLLAAHIGRRRNYHTGVEYDFTAEHLAQLRALKIEAPTPSRYLLITATCDEILDYRDGVEHYRDGRQIVIEGGDHGLGQFGEYLYTALEFCGVAPDTTP